MATISAQQDGSQHAGYVSLRDGSFHDISRSLHATDFGAAITSDALAMFDQGNGDLWFESGAPMHWYKVPAPYTNVPADQGAVTELEQKAQSVSSVVHRPTIFTVSPSGKVMIYNGGINGDFMTVPAGVTQVLTGDRTDGPPGMAATWWGGKVVMACDDAIFVDETHLLCSNGPRSAFLAPDPSNTFSIRDLSQLRLVESTTVFNANPIFQGKYLYVSTAAAFTQVLPANQRQNIQPAVEPGGGRVAFISSGNGDSGVYVSALDATTAPREIKKSVEGSVELLAWQ